MQSPRSTSLIGLALLAWVGCARPSLEPRAASTPRAEPRAPAVPRAEPSAPVRLLDPKRATTIDVKDFDPSGLPELVRATDLELPPSVRAASRLEVSWAGTIEFKGVDALDVEAGDARAMLVSGHLPWRAGDTLVQREGPVLPAVWRGPAEVVDGDLRVVCFEGDFDPSTGIAVASKRYQVLAKAIVPDLVYAYRSGHPEPRDAASDAEKAKVGPEPCVGRAAIEFIGPSALWISGSEQSAHDGVVVPCIGACPFSRVTTPIARGAVTTSILVTSDPTDRVRLPSAEGSANVFSYTFEIDWTTDDAPTGRVFIAAASAQPQRIRAIDELEQQLDVFSRQTDDKY